MTDEKTKKKTTKTAPKKQFNSNVVGKKTAQNDIKMAYMAVTIIVQFIVIIFLIIALTMGRTGANTDLADGTKQVVSTKSSSLKLYRDKIDASAENGFIGDHVLGNVDSETTAIMYVDMQCPACASVMPRFTSVFNNYQNKAKFIIRYYIISGHNYARPAAIAVEAAAKQGYYWEMMNALFTYRSNWAYVNSDELLQSRFVEIFVTASGSKGDKEKFLVDLKDENLAKKVDFDHSIGVKDNINATPTIIVNGKEIDFENSTEGVETLFKRAIEEG